MSFILDALKKSESERQQQTGAEFSDVPSGSGQPHPYKWLVILALLLAVNFAALLIVLLRPGVEPEQPASVVDPPVEAVAGRSTALPEPSFKEQVAEAKVSHEEREVSEASTPEPAVREAAVAQTGPARRTAPTKSIYELRAEGRLQIADLHLDIHVFSEERDERFVFINMVKHREGSQLPEGPVVNEITPDGVILGYQGMTFLLPRE